MKIVSWNCNGGFFTKEKYKKIRELDADIYVISEINNPKTTDIEYDDFIKNSIYLEYEYGVEEKSARAKGLSIIAGKDVKIKDNNWYLKESQDFISVRVNDTFDLVGVWTHEPYTKNLVKYLRIYEENIRNSENIIVCGDFNISLAIDNEKNKDMFAKILNSYGLKSIYHSVNDEKMGEETSPTLYWRHNEKNRYHVDYLFTKEELIKDFKLGSYDEYSDYSDHAPLIFEIDI